MALGRTTTADSDGDSGYEDQCSAVHLWTAFSVTWSPYISDIYNTKKRDAKFFILDNNIRHFYIKVNQ